MRLYLRLAVFTDDGSRQGGTADSSEAEGVFVAKHLLHAKFKPCPIIISLLHLAPACRSKVFSRGLEFADLLCSESRF